MKTLITGATGTLGQEVTRRLLEFGYEVVAFSRDEQKHQKLPKNNKLQSFIGDVRDYDALLEASSGCDQIFHFAALKCLNLYEHAPNEVLKTNILGTYNVDRVQRNNHSIKRVVFSSTDKACYPINVYGNTKAIGEKIIASNSNNVVCRYGNVLGSRGSFLSVMIEKLLTNKPIPITHTMASRFFLTIQEAASFVVGESLKEDVKEVRIPKMNAIYMTDLVKVIAKILNVGIYAIEEVGLRPGEKVHEVLSMEHEPQGLITSEDNQFLPHQAFDYFSSSVNAIVAGMI